MKVEKKSFVEQVCDHLGKSDYVSLADFSRVNVAPISALRKKLRENNAECRIVKNSILKLALAENGHEDLGDQCFEGHTAIIVRGADPPGAAKTLVTISKDNEQRMGVQGDALSKHSLAAREMRAVCELPSFEALRAQVFALFNTPAQVLVNADAFNLLSPYGLARPVLSKCLRSDHTQKKYEKVS
jgi:large subunit ribosomal protein L10